MLTLFAIPKPFRGNTGVIQRNAIESWTRLNPGCEVILCGNDEGAEEISKKFRIRHIADIERNEFGTPLINSLFERVEQTARWPILCYVNADIILLNDFIVAVQSIHLEKYVMIGQRWDVNLLESWNFETEGWEIRLKHYISHHGYLHPATGIDYIVFPRGVFGKLPPFAVGRPAWDNWMVYRARSLRIPVVDATRATIVIHQNHDYAHVSCATDNTTEGPEAVTNRELTGGWGNIFDIKDATHLLTRSSSSSPDALIRLLKNWRTLPVFALRARKKVSYLSAAGLRFLKRRIWSHKHGGVCAF